MRRIRQDYKSEINETTGHRISITDDVPVLRIDHVSIERKLLGVWQALYSGCVLDLKEMNRRFAPSVLTVRC